QGLPGPNEKVGRIGLAICRDQPDNLYALFTDGFFHTGLYRTKDGGSSWSETDPERDLQNGSSNFSWYFGQVRVNPSNPENVFVLDVALMGSEDGGRNWPVFESGGLAGPHVDHHALAFHPQNPNRIIDGNDGGIYLSNDAGQNWQKSKALPVTQFYHITHDPSNPERLYGGTQDNGTVRTNTGGTNDWQRILGGDGFYALIDPQDPDIIYAESQFGNLAKSINGGKDWTTILNGINTLEPTNWSTPVIFDQNDPQKLYYGTHSVYKTWNGGESWRKFSPKLTDFVTGRRIGTITSIAPASSDTSVVYIGTDDALVWVTEDAGETWREISEDLPYRWVTRVRIDPLDAKTAYVTFSGLKWNSPQPHVFLTNNMGASWQDISANLPDAPVNSIIIDPQNRNALFVATDVGVFYSENAGNSWSPLGRGMPMVSVYDFVIDKTNRYLIAGTHGRSMYRISIDAITSVRDFEMEAPIESFALDQNYPNPFNAETIIEFILSQSEHITLKIFNTLGQEVVELVSEKRSAGLHTLRWNGTDANSMDVPSGMYIYQMAAASGQIAKRRMVMLR
ncbi:MAG: T9SS type A sorting domain-containing protein, partial [bacterium]